MTKFTLVCCDTKSFKTDYKRNRIIESIDHGDIIMKLETNDIYKSKPSEDIVQFFIINKINKALSNQIVETIYYRIDQDNLSNKVMVESIKLLLNTFSHKIESFNLIVPEGTQIKTTVKRLFDEITS